MNGADLVATLLQICYATALGFLLTVLFLKGKSLFPGIILHGVLNTLSLFRVSGTRMQSILSSAALCVMATAYALWIWKKTECTLEVQKG